MATEKQIEDLLIMFKEVEPEKILDSYERVQNGIGGVLKVLYEKGKPLSAGKLSEELGVSNARVAHLINKMSAKSLIETEHPKSDSRVTLISLTNLGRSEVVKRRNGIEKIVSSLLDIFGEKKLVEYINMTGKIKNAIAEVEKA